MRYFLCLMRLFLSRKISLATVRYALRERPLAVAGRGGSYAVWPDLHANEDRMQRRALAALRKRSRRS